ncbi:glycosyltransferase family 2 protein [Paracoccus aerius]
MAKGRDIVVVDNGPDPETEAVTRRNPGVRYVQEPRPGLSRARNAGIAVARGDVAVFVDDDVRPEPGWIEPLLAGFARGSMSSAAWSFLKPWGPRRRSPSNMIWASGAWGIFP